MAMSCERAEEGTGRLKIPQAIDEIDQIAIDIAEWARKQQGANDLQIQDFLDNLRPCIYC